MSNKLLPMDSALPTTQAVAAAAWLEQWGLAPLVASVRLRYSRRMYRCVGRCYPDRLEVVLADAVREMDDTQQQAILCHELAHIAAYALFGRAIRPHGKEWRALVRSAGFTPSVRFDHPASLEILNNRAPRRTRYLHVCPACRRRRTSARRMLRWRCGACWEIGRDGRLEIITLDG